MLLRSHLLLLGAAFLSQKERKKTKNTIKAELSSFFPLLFGDFQECLFFLVLVKGGGGGGGESNVVPRKKKRL